MKAISVAPPTSLQWKADERGYPFVRLHMRDLKQQFSDAFERYSGELFRHCALRLLDKERALELTQETFLRAFEYARRGKEIREFRPFLYQTLKHLIIDEYRKTKSLSLEQLIEEREGGSIEDLAPKDESNTLERALERYEGKRALESIARLPEPYQEALLLRYVEGFSPKEIAHLIGESENVVSVRIHRGLKKLKTLLEKES